MPSYADTWDRNCDACGSIFGCTCPEPPREYVEALNLDAKPTTGTGGVPKRPQTCPKHLHELVCEDCSIYQDSCDGEDDE